MKLIRLRRSTLGIAIFLFISSSVAYASDAKVGSPAEWFSAKTILMHTPANETFWEIIHPSAALYERPFSLQKAVAEHRRYIEALRNAGATVYTVVETLLRGTMNENGDPVPGKELNELRDFAK